MLPDIVPPPPPPPPPIYAVPYGALAWGWYDGAAGLTNLCGAHGAPKEFSLWIRSQDVSTWIAGTIACCKITYQCWRAAFLNWKHYIVYLMWGHMCIEQIYLKVWLSGIAVACVCLCVCVSVCVSITSFPRDNSSPVQARITNFGVQVQKVHIVFGVIGLDL